MADSHDQVGEPTPKDGAELAETRSTVASTATRERVIEFRQKSTARISDTVRVLSIGYLVMFFGLYTQNNSLSDNMAAKLILIVVGICGIASLFMDYMQYCESRKLANDTLKYGSESGKYDYNRKSSHYVNAERYFESKQISCVIGAFAVMVFFIVTIFA